MNKRYLPIIASIFILAMVVPVFAQPVLRYMVAPTLVVRTIPEDDEFRKTGIILLADTYDHFKALQPLPSTSLWPVGYATDLIASFKIIVTYNGVGVTPNNIYCQVIEKDKYNPIKDKQNTWENYVTHVKDQSDLFECKWRVGKQGVGVLDVYYVGTIAPQYIADYILVVGVSYAIGRTTVYGTEMQDICVLGWYAGSYTPYFITKPDGTHHYIFPDALGPWNSCEDAALFQKHFVLGLPVPWT